MRIWATIVVLAAVVTTSPLVRAQAVADSLSEAASKELHEAAPADKLRLIDQWGDQGAASKDRVSALVEALDDTDVQLRAHAARALGSIGPSAVTAVTKLTSKLTDEQADVRAYAAYALGRIGRESMSAVPALVVALEDNNPTVRRMAVQAIVGIKPPANVVVPVLLDVLRNSEPAVVVPALHSLADNGEEALPLLIDAMEDAKARYWVCVVLGSMGPKAQGAVGALAGATHDADQGVRRESLLALGEIGPSAAEAVPYIIKALDDPDSAVRAAAVLTLGKLGPKAQAAVDPLGKRLEGRDQLVRTLGIWALVRIEPKNKLWVRTAGTILRESLTNSDPQVRAAAAHALTDLRLSDAASIEALVAALADATVAVRESAIEALGDMGEPAVAPITKALSKPGTRGAAALVVAKMGPVAKSSINALVAALADTNPATREQVLIALASLGKSAQTAGPSIAKVLEHDPEYHVQQSAAYALWQIGSQAGNVALITTLHSKHSSLAITSAAALAHLDPANSKTVKLILPVLVEGLKHPREAVQLEACAGLAALGRAGASAVPSLNLALTDDDEQVRRAAHDAIERIQRPGDSK